MRSIAARRLVTLVALTIATGCGTDGESDGSSMPAAANTPTATLAADSTPPVPTLMDPLGTSSNVNSILAAVAARRVSADIDGRIRSFSSIAVVDVLGLATSDGHVQFDGSAPALTESERSSILNALRPRVVTFIALDQAQQGIDAGTWQAVLVLASPVFTDGVVTVTSELLCGTFGAACADGGIHVLGVNADGEWTVTKSNGGWIT